MKEIRPLGSERLSGDAKIQRILEIANYGRTQKPSNIDKPEYVTESSIGGVYGIVKEKDGFYVKKGLNESSLEYIGGMFMKNKNRFTSYGEAYKRLDFLKGQDMLQEATKYVLKQTKSAAPSMEAPTPEPAMDELPPMDSAGGAPAPDAGVPPTDEPSPEGQPSPEGGDQQNLRSSYMAEIQKFAGKLGQELRDQKDILESDDLKYVLNMIISAIDLDQLDDDDYEEIADKFDPEKRNQGGEGEEFGGEPAPEEAPVPPSPEGDMAEESDDFQGLQFNEEDEDIDETINKLDEFINTPMEQDDNIFGKYSDLGKEEDMDEFYDEGADDDNDEFDNQMSSIHKIMNSDNPVKSHGNIDWEQKLRNKPSVHNEKPSLDIDEIAQAITNALSKYR